MTLKEKFEPGFEVYNSKHGLIQLPENTEGLSNKQRSYLKLAIRMAETSEARQYHGAVVVKGGSVLSLGVNRWRNKSLLLPGGDYNPHVTIHAEIDALKRAGEGARGATVYVASIGKNGEERFSRPCNLCAKALIAAGVKQVVYTMGDKDGF